jgi:hypothetical protein
MKRWFAKGQDHYGKVQLTALRGLLYPSMRSQNEKNLDSEFAAHYNKST